MCYIFQSSHMCLQDYSNLWRTPNSEFTLRNAVLLCTLGSASLVPIRCREKLKEWQKHFSNYNPGHLLFQGTLVKLLSTSLHFFFFFYFLPALKSMPQSSENTEQRNDHNCSLGQQGSASLGPLICTSSFVSPWTVWYICSHLTRHDNGNFHNDQKYQWRAVCSLTVHSQYPHTVARDVLIIVMPL